MNYDSLQVVLKQMPEDTNKVLAMNKTIWNIRNANPELGIELGLESIALANKIKYDRGRLEAMSFTGVCYRNMGDYPKAFEWYFQQLEESQKLGFKENECYANINIGNLYIYQKKADEAIKMLEAALKINAELNNEKQEAYVRLNLGRCYIMKGEFDQGEEYLNRALELRTRNGDTEGAGVIRKYLGDIHYDKKQYREGLEDYIGALNAVSANTDKDFHADVLNKIAYSYLMLGDAEHALEKALDGMKIARNANVKPRIRDLLGTLADIYAKLGQFQKAYDHQEQYIAYYDSLSNDDINNRIADIKFEIERKQTERENELKAAQAELEKQQQESQITVLEEQKRTETTIKYAMAAGMSLFIGLLFVVLRAHRQSKRQNKLLQEQKAEIEKQNNLIQKQHDEVITQRNIAEEQRKIVEEKNKEILDSISYAKRIQTAILPTEKYFRQQLPQSFVLYLPKDIVAGDFYWMEVVGETVLYAAADCTGHGVPGAMVSVVCNNALNRSVREFRLTNPAKILDKTREIVMQEFEKSEMAMKDGMDISLVAVNVKERKVQWAGANNSLWIIRNGHSEMLEWKGDKQPIGYHSNMHPFQHHELLLEPEDVLYVTTDGFQDQFGANNGKKYKSRRLKEYIQSIQHLPIHDQQEALRLEFENWRTGGNTAAVETHSEQVDDVCVIGVRV